MISFRCRLLLLTILFGLSTMVMAAQTKKLSPKPTPTPAPNVKNVTGGGCSHVQAFEYDRITYQNTVSDTNFATIQKWNPEVGERAMSFGKVTKIARTYLRTLNLDEEPTQLDSVAIYRFCGENWVYAVTFVHGGPEKVVKVGPDDLRVLGRYFYLFIRPDGVPIKPAERSRLKTID